MKRYGYLFDKLQDYEFVKTTILKASKGKTKRYQVRKVMDNLETYTDLLYRMIKEDKIYLRPSHTRTIKENGKERLITISPFFPNQCLDYLLVEVLMPIIKKPMYEYCIGNVDERGIVYGQKYIEKNISKYKYFIKLDIHHFYQSVDTKVLIKLLTRKIKDKKFIRFADKIISADGLPIGCYYSQWLSNFYLCEFDHYVKEELGIPFYVRYVDDMLLLSNNKRQLKNAQWQIKRYLETLKLELKRQEQVYEIATHNISFIGFLFSHSGTKLRRKMFYKIQRTVNKARKHYNLSLLKRLIAYMGWLKQIKIGYAYYKNHIRPILKIGYVKYKISLSNKLCII